MIDDELRDLLDTMTDHVTDELFAVPGFPSIVFPLSRLIVDPERFPDDAHERMALKGMGVIYERGPDGRVIRDTPTPGERGRLLEHWYWPHHRALEDAVRDQLAKYDRCVIIDGHSFPLEALPYEDVGARRPELCLGTDAFHTPPEIVEAARAAFEQHGFEVGLDEPFTGALVPQAFHEQDERVHALMIEVRRDLYWDDVGRTATAGSEAVNAAIVAVASSLASM